MSLARRLWSRLEAWHAVVYFAPEVRVALDGVGLKGFWMGYFAGRAAPLGPVDAPIVVALFHGFHPARVERALPDAWAFASPPQILEARLRGVDAALRRVAPGAIGNRDVERACALALEVASAAPVSGRGLFAAHMSLPVPDEPLLALWHAATLLREHRGDGHVAALTAAALDGCAAHVIRAASDDTPRELFLASRGWSDADWNDAVSALIVRGLLRDDGKISDAGRELLAEVEATTDRLAGVPLDAIGSAGAEALCDLLDPLARAVGDAALIPFPNPIGLPRF